jgi:peptidoglycan-associated lipoprotein
VIAEPPPTPVATPVAPPQLTTVSVYFDYDSSELLPEVRALLEAFVDQAQKQPDQQIRIEGNCDERGSREYNVALGQRRADAAKKYLTNLGVSADRITTISYGKERPRAVGHDEEAWKENRRDDVVPQGAEKSDAVSQR